MTRQQIIEHYLKIRFPEAPDNYRQQWIARFDRGEEWNFSDFSGRRVLHKLDPRWYPKDVNAFKVLPPYPEN